LLETFHRYGVSSTFYFAGVCAKENADVARLVVEAGHEIGCHSLYPRNGRRRALSAAGVTPQLPGRGRAAAPACHRMDSSRLRRASDVVPFAAPLGSTAVINALESLDYDVGLFLPDVLPSRAAISSTISSRTDWTKTAIRRTLRFRSLPT
jgi:peptidoglycan/xylan/chitin deacetylase (PgdA/CDA1 family)